MSGCSAQDAVKVEQVTAPLLKKSANPHLEPSGTIRPAGLWNTVVSNLLEALAVLKFLEGRLCTKCGVRLAEHANQLNQHCPDCVEPEVEYRKVTVNEFERRIGEAFRRWFQAVPF